MTWAADVVDVERYSKVGICFLGLARKRLLFLSRQEERVIDGNIGQNRGRGPRGGDSDETGRHSVVRQGNSKRFLAKNSQKVALGEGGGRYQRDTKTGSEQEKPAQHH